MKTPDKVSQADSLQTGHPPVGGCQPRALFAVLPTAGRINTEILSVRHTGHKGDGRARINSGVYSLHATSLHFIGRALIPANNPLPHKLHMEGHRQKRKTQGLTTHSFIF